MKLFAIIGYELLSISKLVISLYYYDIHINYNLSDNVIIIILYVHLL
jgi:hypothetical protein